MSVRSGFDRTVSELKPWWQGIYELRWTGFDRTVSELKLKAEQQFEKLRRSFDRTVSELKPSDVGKANI